MKKTSFNITQMDCPSEEQMIRMKLESIENIKQLNFDIPNRKLDVIHSSDSATILNNLEELKLGASLVSESNITQYEHIENSDNQERKMLYAVLIINFSFFIIELLYGWLFNSMGLIADSLDMLADSLVYSLSLMAVGSSIIKKKKVAKWSGYFQLTLAFIGFSELLRRVFGNSTLPEFKEMIGFQYSP